MTTLRSTAHESAPAIDVRGRLLEGAIDCVERKGYAATTARDISAASGANLASIGYHFGSKEQLLDEALIVACERWLAPVVNLGRRPGPQLVRERIVRGLEEFIASLEPNRPTIQAFFEALARVERSPAVRGRLAASYEALREVVGEAVAMGDEVRDAAGLDQQASAIIALYDGILLQWLIDPTRHFDAPALVDGIARQTPRT